MFDLNTSFGTEDVHWGQGAIYTITNKQTGEFYVGATSRPLHERWMAHRRAWKQKSRSKLYRAMDEFGFNRFRINKIASCVSLEDLALLEADVIRERKPHYNTISSPEDIWSKMRM